jgi:CheY-like chemotaxis protein
MSSKRTTVFLVDDDNELRESVEALLEGKGYLVLGARSGGEALARMQGTYGGSIAVIDLLMPGMDGWQLCTAMRNDAALRHIPILVVSGQGSVAVEGADLVLAKPCVGDRLCEAVDELVTRRAPN